MKHRHGFQGLILSGILISSVPIFAQTAPSSTSPTTATEARSVPSSAGIAVSSDYVLKSNDVVAVSVFQEPELACTERIAGDGSISMPLVGRIKISGLTPVSAAAAINAALRQGYLVSPQSTLSVSEATKEYFTLLGQVASPGPVEIPATTRINLLQAIGMGGGFTRLANPSKVTIKRTSNGQETLITVDAKKLAADKGMNAVWIQPGDVVTVKERLF